MSSPEEEYVAFAAQVSFLELGREEFGEPLIDVSEYEEEIRLLGSRSDWGAESLSELMNNHPRAFSVLEAVLQQQRFTPSQLVHFFFDVVKMNSPNIDSVYQYALLNIDHDRHLSKQCSSFLDKLSPGSSLPQLRRGDSERDRMTIVAAFKMAASRYAEKVAEKPELLKLRIAEPVFKESSYRLADYVIHRLRLNDLLGCTDLRALLAAKRAPKDNKGMTGDYAKARVVASLERDGYTNIDAVLNTNGIRTLKTDVRAQLSGNLPGGKLFCTERYVDGVVKPKENKPKKFDVVILVEGRPKHLFEVNFYTTTGTKIGINEGEYIDLKGSIDRLGDLEFHWITDGNYWLSPGGKDRFERLSLQFGGVFNLNTFEASLSKFS